MQNTEQQNNHSFASVLGSVIGLIGGEIAVAVAVVGGLWTGYTAVAAAERS